MSAEDQYFVEIVEILQESLLDDNFDDIQTNFMKTHCFVFEPEEENKMEEMEVFLKYRPLCLQTNKQNGGEGDDTL